MGPTLNISEEIHAMKYRGEGETFREGMTRVADGLKDNEEHFNILRDILCDQSFLPAGRGLFHHAGHRLFFRQVILIHIRGIQEWDAVSDLESGATGGTPERTAVRLQNTSAVRTGQQFD